MPRVCKQSKTLEIQCIYLQSLISLETCNMNCFAMTFLNVHSSKEPRTRKFYREKFTIR